MYIYGLVSHTGHAHVRYLQQSYSNNYCINNKNIMC